MIVSLKCKWLNYHYQCSRQEKLHLNRSLGYRTCRKHKSPWKLFLMHEFHPTIHKTKTTQSPSKGDSLKQKKNEILEKTTFILLTWDSKMRSSFQVFVLEGVQRKKAAPLCKNKTIKRICALFTSHLQHTVYGRGHQTIKLNEQQPMIRMMKKLIVQL